MQYFVLGPRLTAAFTGPAPTCTEERDTAPSRTTPSAERGTSAQLRRQCHTRADVSGAFKDRRSRSAPATAFTVPAVSDPSRSTRANTTHSKQSLQAQVHWRRHQRRVDLGVDTHNFTTSAAYLGGEEAYGFPTPAAEHIEPGSRCQHATHESHERARPQRQCHAHADPCDPLREP